MEEVDGIPTDAGQFSYEDPQRPGYLCGHEAAFIPTTTERIGVVVAVTCLSVTSQHLINQEMGRNFCGNAYQTGEIGGGVYRTVNAGKTWARIDLKEHRLASQRIWSLAFDSQDQNTLFVGSHSAGVYVVPRRSETVSAESR